MSTTGGLSNILAGTAPPLVFSVYDLDSTLNFYYFGEFCVD